MTPYSASDLSGDYEFKILRSATGGFRKAEKLREALDAEAVAGWTLVEKFDNSRLRLKRPASYRAADGKLDFDPYRTSVGMGEGPMAALIVLGIFGALGLALLLILAITWAR